MKTNQLVLLLQAAGLLHLGLAGAGALMPRVVHLRAHLTGLPEFIRRLFWIYYLFIGLCLFGFGIITVLFAGTLAAAGGLARALCVFLAAFWSIRLIAAAFVFDVRPYLTTRWLRAGYQATNLAFLYLVAIYALAAWKGGRL